MALRASSRQERAASGGCARERASHEEHTAWLIGHWTTANAYRTMQIIAAKAGGRQTSASCQYSSRRVHRRWARRRRRRRVRGRWRPWWARGAAPVELLQSASRPCLRAAAARRRRCWRRGRHVQGRRRLARCHPLCTRRRRYGTRFMVPPRQRTSSEWPRQERDGGERCARHHELRYRILSLLQLVGFRRGRAASVQQSVYAELLAPRLIWSDLTCSSADVVCILATALLGQQAWSSLQRLRSRQLHFYRN